MSKGEKKLLLEKILFQFPQVLIVIILDYQDFIHGNLIRKWEEKSFKKPRSLSFVNNLCYISDGDSRKEKSMGPLFAYTYRIQIFEIQKNGATLIRTFGKHGEIENDEFLFLLDFKVTEDGQQIIFLDSTFRIFSLPNFELISSLENFEDEEFDKQYNYCQYGYGLCLHSKHFYISVVGCINQFDQNGIFVQRICLPCFSRLRKMIIVDDCMWITDYNVIHILDLKTMQCKNHCGKGDLDEPYGLVLDGTEVLVVNQNEIVVFDKVTLKKLRSFGQEILRFPAEIVIYKRKAWITDLQANCVFIFE